MREIEIKLKAPNLEEVTKKLVSMGCKISEPTTQKDVNFVHINDIKWFESNGGDWLYPRLRIQNGKPLIFTVKKPIKNEMDCIEHELEIDSEEELRGIMKLFNYREGVTVEKIRRKCEFKDYTITLDQVKNLGDFIEIERVVEDGDAEKIQAEMFQFAKDTFGLEKNDEIMKGYDILIHLSKK